MEKKLRDGVAHSMREIVFGLEDSLVSTLGAVTGIAAGTHNSYVVILSGLVLIVVESISMSAGSYLSSKAAAEVEETHGTEGRRLPHVFPLRAGVVMFFAYILGGFFPLGPYLLLPIERAILPSVIITLVVLFLVGAWKASFTRRSWVKSGLEMMAVSMTAAFLGYLIGRLVSNVFGISVV